MKRRDLIFGAVAASALGGCTASKFKTYSGPEVTYVVVEKSARRMYLFHNDKVLKSYDIDLGFAPDGHKQFEGDGRTPEGTYVIDRRNPNSKFHLSLGISYPNADDIAAARLIGKEPGGDIFIHGKSSSLRAKGKDWTWGCIAVTDREIEKIYAMVSTGTVVDIYP